MTMGRRRIMWGIRAALLVVAVVFFGFAVWFEQQLLAYGFLIAGLGFIVSMVGPSIRIVKAICLNLPQRVILAISVPAIIVVVVLSVEGDKGYWTARESGWVWVLAIGAVTAFELFLWRKRRKPGDGT